MPPRYWILLLLHTTNIIHLFCIIFAFIEPGERLLSSEIPKAVYVTINCMAMFATVILYIGLFTLDIGYILAYLVLKLFMLHIPIIMLIIICVLDRTYGPMQINEKAVLIPCLWFCTWALTFIKAIRIRFQIKEFGKIPDFLQNNPNLMQRLDDVQRRKSRTSFFIIYKGVD